MKLTREQLMKMSKKELKEKMMNLAKEAQDKTGEELTETMDAVKLIGEILDEIKAREELMAAANAAAGDLGKDQEGEKGEEGGEVKNQARAKSGKENNRKEKREETFKNKDENKRSCVRT